MSLFFPSLLQLLLDPNLVVSLLTQRQPLSLGNIISITSLFLAFKLSTHYFYLSWSTLYSESLLFMFFLSLWLFFMASVTLPYLLETQHAVMPPFTQSQGQPPLVCFLIMMSEAQVPFLSFCMTTSSFILLPWVIWCWMYLYSWLYIPCFSSSAFGALPYRSILVLHLFSHTLLILEKINPNHLEFFLSSNLNRCLFLVFYPVSSYFYVFA